MSEQLISKRHLRRLVKKNLNSFKNSSAKQIEINIGNREEDQSDNEADSVSNNIVPAQLEKEPLAKKLAFWAIKNRVSRNTCDELLCILKSENLNVPDTRKTLLRTYQPEEITVLPMSPGKYFHYGLEKALKMKLKYFTVAEDELLLDIFCDGMPIFKSSSKSLWPIVGCISNCEDNSPFLIGTYIGPSKPPNVVTYVEKFVEEYTRLKNDGFVFQNRLYKPKIRLFVCDAPAKAFLTGTLGHTSSFGCTKCDQKAVRINKRLTYSLSVGNLRTDEGFKNRCDKNFHCTKFHSSPHPFEDCGIQMISQFPLDVMHLFDLGVVKKTLILMWDSKNPIYKLSVEKKNTLNARMKMMIKCTPKEFGRKCRSLDELVRWKAIEFRQFVLYTGFVVLKNLIDPKLYDHFLLLMSAYRFLSSPKEENKSNLSCAQQLLEAFVVDFASLYGENRVSFNVHNLLHISQCVQLFGNADNFSAYKFENFLQVLKKDCRNPNYIAQQLNNRLSERSFIPPNKAKFRPLGKLIDNTYAKYQCGNFFLSNKFPDCYCLTLKLEIFHISAFLEENGRQAVRGKFCSDISSSFEYPVNSRSALGISKGSTFSDTVQTVYLENIYCKLFPIAEANYYHFVPLLHHCQ